MPIAKNIICAAILFPLAIAAPAAQADTGVTATPELPARDFAWQPSPGDAIIFDVLRKGSSFGTHSVRFQRDGEGRLTALVDVDLRAGLGPITLFRYQLDVRETWQDGYVHALEGSVNDDGERQTVSARRSGGQLLVDGTDFKGELPAGIIPASHWNIWQTDAGRLLSTESGELIDIDVRELGRETIIAGGREIEARKFLLDSDIDVTLWYDDQDRWVKLAFEARGQDIEYVLREPY
jgi:hypothetical protein